LIDLKMSHENPNLSTAEFNVREVTKQLLLLEDHMFDVTKRCNDCIKKHLMTVEALSEEAVTLDSQCIWCDKSRWLATKAREWMTRVLDQEDLNLVAQDIRMVRKGLLELIADPRLGKPEVSIFTDRHD
jgi:hypothetical protein